MKKGLSRGLGKGLDALMTYNSNEPLEASGEIVNADINAVVPNADQPRKVFKPQEIEELAESIKEFGIIQPLIVKQNGDTYTIIAGERRWRAANAAGLSVVPVIVRDYTELEILGIALIENIQREDLNPVEEAMCYKRLNEDFGITQDEIAKKIGKSRSHISNCIRILKLQDSVLEMVSQEELTMGHAKALLAVEDVQKQVELAKKIFNEQMNVRKTEELVRNVLEEEKDLDNSPKKLPSKSINKTYVSYQSDLNNFLKTRVNIKDNKKEGSGGKIEIAYFSPEDLERIIGVIKSRI